MQPLLKGEYKYSCRIIASCGSKSSLPATLEVYPQTAIIIQPVVFAAVENGNASFSVTADGNSLSYQWYRDALALSDGGVYSGANTSDSDTYRVDQCQCRIVSL